MIGDLLVFGAVVAVFAIVGVVVGMLVAPRLGRMTEQMGQSDEEDAGDGTD